MNAATLSAIIMASVMVLGMLGTLVTLVFKIGTLNGRLITFMEVVQRDNNLIAGKFGSLDSKLDRHIEWHTEGKR